MHAAHNFLCRLFFYVLAIMFFNTAFGSWPESTNPAFYFAYYGSRFVSYIALFEAVYQVISYARHKKVPIPETQPLPQAHVLPVDRETRRIDKP